MLKKENRLRKTKEVTAALGRGRSFHSPLFVVKFVATSGHMRATVVVSTKVSKKAVARNRLKRLVREVLRLSQDNLRLGDYVVIVKPVAGKTDEQQIRPELVGLLQKTKLLSV